MSQQDFIFSDQARHRLMRHLAFWMIWSLVHLLLFHYPVYSFRGWNLSLATANVQKLGLPVFVLKTLVFQTLLGIVLPQAVFIYLLLYGLLPRYFNARKNRLVTATMLVGMLVGCLFVFVAGKLLCMTSDSVFDIGKTKSPKFNFSYAFKAALRDQLTSLPIIAGFALMIKLMKRWWLKQKETEQLAREKTKAELQLLKAQVHPHFLFNTLNNIYYFTLTGAPEAPDMIRRLSGLLHYILNECNAPFVPLEKEINMIRDYLALEQIRYGEQMNMTVDIQADQPGKMIAPLLLIPFVENSFKHGASKMLAHPWIKLYISVAQGMLHFRISNSRPPAAEPVLKQGNIGLKNVKRRLELLYPGTHELHLDAGPESFAVSLSVLLREPDQNDVVTEEQEITTSYAMA